ncbi:MAG: HAMP domain-containing histidine kinase, partial [Lachnospiraceae bacterium]|nr:HAMP domain-containing histidine kinase [Lachnospiraceae bacterium]
ARNHYFGTYASTLICHSLYGFLFVILFLFLISFSLFLTYRRTRKLTKDIKTVSDKLAKLKDGTQTAPLVLSKGSLLKETAEDINALEDGMEKMAEQKNRSNKLRVELLTNVSHDLKTPLTSIINYADLLCEEQLNENAAVYAASLRAKAYRLKSMVQDVFELSKATSGNLPVEKQTLDLVKLVRQTLADMEERIQESSLTFKTIISEESMLIEADGEKLYRVFQNLFVNALQYSLENSRVYVMLSVDDGNACAKIKNTSKWEIDFTPDDIMERFVRADASRTTEGSGLGLSIVQSFSEVCGGSFSIETDADMFTAFLRFPLIEKAEADSANQNEEKESP